ncbi:hypothetical protein KUCAC02_031866, partial [Chaenocephalus aceratus]
LVERKKSALIVLGLWGEEVGPLGVSCSLSRYYIMFIQEEVQTAVWAGVLHNGFDLHCFPR